MHRFENKRYFEGVASDCPQSCPQSIYNHFKKKHIFWSKIGTEHRSVRFQISVTRLAKASVHIAMGADLPQCRRAAPRQVAKRVGHIKTHVIAAFGGGLELRQTANRIIAAVRHNPAWERQRGTLEVYVYIGIPQHSAIRRAREQATRLVSRVANLRRP